MIQFKFLGKIFKENDFVAITISAGSGELFLPCCRILLLNHNSMRIHFIDETSNSTWDLKYLDILSIRPLSDSERDKANKEEQKK